MPITDHEVITVLVLEDLKPLDSDLPLTSVLASPGLLSETQKKCSKNFSEAASPRHFAGGANPARESRRP